MNRPRTRTGMIVRPLCIAFASLALSAGCSDNSKPTAHEPDTHDMQPDKSAPVATAKPAPPPAPPAVVSSNPPAVTRPPAPPPRPTPPSNVDPLNPPSNNRSGAANLKPVEGPETYPETVPPTEPEPPFPPGVTVMEEERPATKTSVRVQVEDGDRVTIETHNVKRMSLHRDRLGVSGRRSAVLHIDGQILEWTRDAEIVEFDRTRSGLWAVVRTSP